MSDDQASESGAGPIPEPPSETHLYSVQKQDLKEVDKDGCGLDAAIFHATVVTKSGQFNFGRLNGLCGTQIAADITAEQLAGFIRSGRITVAQLLDCIRPLQAPEGEDPYYPR